jgi:hypothetical protein
LRNLTERRKDKIRKMSRHSPEDGCHAHDFSFILPHNVLSDYCVHIGSNLHGATERGVLLQLEAVTTHITGR